MQVNIPKPCSENWKEMTPTQRGAFCQKCAIDVIDFSNKSPIEVKETLKANIGKHMCGRFKKSQLEDLSQSYHIWENQSRRTFQSKFLWACVMVFGMALFTACENSNAQEITSPPVINELVVEGDTNKIKTDTSGVVTEINLVDSIETVPQHFEYELGDIDINYTQDPFEEMMMGQPAIQQEIYTKGEVVAVPECGVKDTLKVDTIEPNPIKERPELIMGKFLPPPKFNDYLEDTVKKENLPERIQTDQLDALVYPNPTTGQTRLSITPAKKAYYEIDVYSFDGRRLFTVYSDYLKKRESIMSIDLTNYPAGIYFVKITSNGSAKALKINKVNS